MSYPILEQILEVCEQVYKRNYTNGAAYAYHFKQGRYKEWYKADFEPLRELLCKFIANIRGVCRGSDQDVLFTTDPQIMHKWSRDKINPQKVTLNYYDALGVARTYVPE